MIHTIKYVKGQRDYKEQNIVLSIYSESIQVIYYNKKNDSEVKNIIKLKIIKKKDFSLTRNESIYLIYHKQKMILLSKIFIKVKKNQKTIFIVK